MSPSNGHVCVFVGGMSFGLRDSCLLCKPLPLEPYLQTIFALVIFQIGSLILPGPTWTRVLLPTLSYS
jgi:hypothetical protein